MTGADLVAANDGSHERLYNPDGFGCGALACAAVLTVVGLLLFGPVAVVALARGWVS